MDRPFGIKREAPAREKRQRLQSHTLRPVLGTALRETGRDSRRSQCGAACDRRPWLRCADGYFGSWAANGYFNPRRAIINTLNAAHTLFLDIPWGGQERNPSPYYPANSPAMLIGLTRGNAPFGYCDHVDDRGHVLMPGPTGSGKTTAIAYTTLLHHRIAGARSFNFDCGYGMYVPTLAVGGLHYDLGADTTCFQPLRHIGDPEERAFVHGWLSEDLLPFGGINPAPERDEALWRALEVMAELPPALRTLTNLKYTVQDQTIRDGLTFFTHEGPAGRYLDGDHDGLGESRFITFEIERLMGQGERVLVPVLSHLFHRIDQRLDGRPTRITADELWIMLARARFAANAPRIADFTTSLSTYTSRFEPSPQIIYPVFGSHQCVDVSRILAGVCYFSRPTAGSELCVAADEQIIDNSGPHGGRLQLQLEIHCSNSHV